ncbi:hypothetical protein MMC26_006431 [Xylographa opegraphella]|nr:hypothetical protein [Xylographa opegraphella]
MFATNSIRAQSADGPAVYRDDLTCAPALTIIVTVSTTTTVTETADLATKLTSSSNPGPDTFSLATPSHTVPFLTTPTSDITETTVIWETYTVVSSVAAASSPTLTSPASGLYSFLVINGITSWLGGFTPPVTDSFVIATATIVIEPVPTSPSLSNIVQAQNPIPVTSTDSIQVTSIFTVILAETLTESASATVVSATAGSFHGIGTHGWNATTLTRVTHVKHGSGTGRLPCVTDASSDFARHSRGPYHGSAQASFGESKLVIKRQIGSMVTATIDGVVVSWTNFWDGNPATSELIDTSHTTLSGTTVSGPPEPSFTVSSETVLTTWSSNTQVTEPIPGQATSVYYYSWPPISQVTIPTSVATSSVVVTSATDSIIVEPTSTEPTSIVPTTVSSINTLPLFPSTYTRRTLSTTATEYSVPTYTAVPAIASSLSSISVAPFPNITSTAGTTATTTASITSSSACNVPDQGIGNFTITFDDLPTFGGSPGDTDYPPIFSPYHHLVWALGFAYAPPPSDPYPPISPPQLGVFVTNMSANVHPVSLTSPPGPGDDVDGEFGAGPNFFNSAFWINAYSAYIGCENAGPEDCEITINGYGFDEAFANTVLVARQTAYQPPCVGLTNCTLMKVTFTEDFRNLTGFQIIASVGTNPMMYTWYMDNLEIGWALNDCESATIRDVDSGTG